jgi:hypothetical protein
MQKVAVSARTLENQFQKGLGMLCQLRKRFQSLFESLKQSLRTLENQFQMG